MSTYIGIRQWHGQKNQINLNVSTKESKVEYLEHSLWSKAIHQHHSLSQLRRARLLCTGCCAVCSIGHIDLLSWDGSITQGHDAECSQQPERPFWPILSIKEEQSEAVFAQEKWKSCDTRLLSLQSLYCFSHTAEQENLSSCRSYSSASISMQFKQRQTQISAIPVFVL